MISAGVPTIAARIDKDQVVKDRIEFVAFQPLFVIDQRAGAAEFRHEHLITKALRCEQILLVSRQPHLEVGLIGNHQLGASFGPSIR